MSCIEYKILSPASQVIDIIKNAFPNNFWQQEAPTEEIIIEIQFSKPEKINEIQISINPITSQLQLSLHSANPLFQGKRINPLLTFGTN